ncbi:GNAT family N-acetyltransferase [Microbacter margulisiae]|uniref:GNAT family N-acetyltransferase n=1 Tax=Microbacter margulisiae TaxID=1350067 RepID=A0A7W5H3M1_9PORP|nr:GNAT family N-acetyltransferase [Microbacter margulisiae]MBB3188586.1 hypothetical protein [Microbacter margulisiae]
MIVRKASVADIDTQLKMFDHARSVMRNSGNITQWTGGYPSREVVESDIASGNSYVCVDDAGEIVATFYFRQGDDPTYAYIENGQWLNDRPYGVVHRLASSGKVKGMGTYCLEWCFGQCSNLRVDTHRDNRIMQSVFTKNGFVECGIIYLTNGAPRLAFQKCMP